MQLPFELNEYNERLARLKRSMTGKGIDAVLLLGGANIYYFNGYPAPDLSAPRPYFLLMPVSGDPVFLVHTGRLLEAKAYSCIDKVFTYSLLTDLPPELPSLIKEAGLAASVIGMELGSEMCLNIPLNQFELLKNCLPHCRFTDASSMLWDLRCVKSEAELDCHRLACRITGDAYTKIFNYTSEGMCQNEIYKNFELTTSQLGGGNQFIIMNSGTGTYDFASGLPSEKKLEKGDMLWIDAGCTIKRYWSDFSRAAIIGKASQKQKDMHQMIVDITNNCVSMIRPGIKCSDLAEYCSGQIDEIEEKYSSDIAALAGRVGHGLGLTSTEPPHIAQYENRILEPGMVITIEPGVATSYGTFHFEHNIIVTTTGHEIISTFPQDLIEINL